MVVPVALLVVEPIREHAPHLVRATVRLRLRVRVRVGVGVRLRLRVASPI